MPTPTIVIVGGVAGGASAAARARRVHEHARVILIEKDPHVSFANCGLPYYLGGEITDRAKLIVAPPQRFREWFNIELRTEHEVTSIDRPRKRVVVKDRKTGDVSEQPYDKLILSPGATPIVPPIAGADAPNVFTLRNLVDTDRIKAFLDGMNGKRAVVVGAGFIGLEMVEMLHRRGLSIDLVDLAPQVLIPLDPDMAAIVREELERHGTRVHLGRGLQSLEAEGGTVKRVVLTDGTALDADFVMLAMGVRPNVALAKQAGLELGKTGGIRVNEFLQTSDPDIYAAGDAVEYHHQALDLWMRVPLAGPANRAGRIAGEHAATGGAPPMSPVLGTAIVRAFGVTAAVTGVTEKSARAAGMANTRALLVPGRSHAGYYPGSDEMVLKLLFDESTGKVLGAQAVGGKGVDKRIDIIATAVRFGATIDDLTGLDLCYAPPFGHAKDPVHMAGFVAQNHRRGLDRSVGVSELPIHQAAGSIDPRGGEAQVLDVRNPEEWNAGHIDGAIWIPLAQLRSRLSELDRTRPVITVCRGGQRAYYAGRILRQNGFTDVATLTGGMLMYPRTKPGA